MPVCGCIPTAPSPGAKKGRSWRIKEFDVVYDDTKDNNSISYDEVRKDVAKPSFPTEKLLSNTQPSGNCYVVPKMVD